MDILLTRLFFRQTSFPLFKVSGLPASKVISLISDKS
jgi:hypothetical protein